MPSDICAESNQPLLFSNGSSQTVIHIKEKDTMHHPEASTPEPANDQKILFPTIEKRNTGFLIYVPVAILLFSVASIMVFYCADDEWRSILMFQPKLMDRPYKLITYMLVHTDKLHMAMNVAMQILFASLPEKEFGPWRVLCVFFGAGFLGAVTWGVFSTNFLAGSSAGLYGLLTSHFALIYARFPRLKYKHCLLGVVVFLILADIVQIITQRYISILATLTIAAEAHIGGGVAGFLLGLVLYTPLPEAWPNPKFVRCTSAILLFIFTILILFLYVNKY